MVFFPDEVSNLGNLITIWAGELVKTVDVIFKALTITHAQTCQGLKSITKLCDGRGRSQNFQDECSNGIIGCD